MGNYNFDDLQYLQIPLPEELLKLKWHGSFTRMKRIIDAKLANDIPIALKKRLLHEKEVIRRIPQEYPLSYEEALKICHNNFNDFSDEELEKLQDENAVEWIFVEGQPYFRADFFDNILKTRNDYAARLFDKSKVESREANFALLNNAIHEIKTKGQLTYHFRLKTGIKIKASDSNKKIKIHLPLPLEDCQVKNFKLIATMPQYKYLNDGSHPQRTIYFEENIDQVKDFYVEYEYDNEMKYVELKPEDVLESQPNFYLHEQAPHIVFTPYLKSLAKEIVKDETNNLIKVKLIYEYITTHITYSFVRNYYTIPNIPEYAALGGKGDCGVQALLFITLCRCVGIPARWQAGLYVTPQDIGNHDWARFYIAPYGWLYADCSFGGSAYRNGDQERWQYYFGHLDPFRMPANSEYQYDLYPPKQFIRQDPYDNQTGEAEFEDRGLYLDEYDLHLEVLEIKKV